MKDSKSSYNQILKSVSIFGGSQVFVVIIGLIRTKVIALLIGPVGVGVIAVFQSVIDMIRTGFVLGMDTAGVKEIAEADNEVDRGKFYRTIARFNRWFVALAFLAFVFCIALCYPISLWAFGTGEYAFYIALLSVTVSLLILGTGRSTILQGIRKIPEMAKSAIWGSILSLVVTLPVYYFLMLDGIILALTANAAIWLIFAEYYYRKQKIEKVKISSREAFLSGLSTMKLGIYVVISGFVGTVDMFLIRAFIVRNINIEAAGLFQSAWVITNVYLGLVLKSMGTDFFPRLSAIAAKKNEVRAYVNEQSYIVLIVACPIIVGMLLFSDFVLSLLYSSEFAYADAVLKWQVLGTFLKVLSWPVAFIMLANNKGFIFLLTEVVFYVAYLLSGYLLYPQYGLDAAGIGYLVAYIIYLPFVMIIGYRITGFKWNGQVIQMILINAILVGVSFYISYNNEYSILWSIALLIASVLYAYSRLKKVFSLDDLKDWFRKK